MISQPETSGESVGIADPIMNPDLEPEQPAQVFEHEPGIDVPDGTGHPPSYLQVARGMYGPLGASDDFIRYMAAVHGTREALVSKRSETVSQEHRDQALALLTGSVSEALHELVGQKGLQLQMNQVGAMAKSLRELAPEPFDAWVHDQLSSCTCLGAMTARRSLLDHKAERAIQKGLEDGRLVASGIMGVEDQIMNFTAGLRQSLAADFDLETIDEPLGLDSALNDFVLARRIACQAQNYIAPSPNPEHLERGLKLLMQARTLDKDFRRAINMIRARSQRRTTKIQVEASAEDGIQVEAETTTSVGSAQVRVAV